LNAPAPSQKFHGSQPIRRTPCPNRV
jgi:hypothetical protein